MDEIKNQNKFSMAVAKNGLPDFCVLRNGKVPVPVPRKRRLGDFGGRIAKLLFYIGLPLYIYTTFFFYFDISNSCYITLYPSVTSFGASEIKRGLRLLKETFPDNYKKVCKNIGSINPNIGCSGFDSAGCFIPYGQSPLKKDTIIVTLSPGNVAWFAAVIAHETCHVIQFKEHRPFDETECHHVDDDIANSLMQY